MTPLLLNSFEVKTAHEILGALSDCLRDIDPSDPFLAGGCAGLALAHAALHEVLPGGGHDALAMTALERAIAILGSTVSTPALFNGFSGVAWAVELLCGDSSMPAADDPNTDVDATLEELLDESSYEGPYDLLDGLAGLGVYALERMPRLSAKRTLELIVKRLADMSEPQEQGIAWRSRREWIPEKFRPAQIPEWNLGVAHGVPGVIGLLGRVTAAEVGTPTVETARALLSKAVSWLLAQDSREAFAYYLGSGVDSEPARLGWCYGDPGIASMLVVAGQAAREPRWTAEGIRIGLRACERPLRSAGVKDAGLCHGAAGLAHIFHRLYSATGRGEFRDASRCWLGELFTMRREQGGCAGYLAYGPDSEGIVAWRADAGFLTGAVGITLALSAALTDLEPVWDRALMLSG